MSASRKSIEAFYAPGDDPSLALTYETSLNFNDEVIATLGVLGPDSYTGRARLLTEGPRACAARGRGGGGGVTLRSMLYALARLLGDVNAVEEGNALQRVERRIAGRLMGRILGRLFR